MGSSEYLRNNCYIIIIWVSTHISRMQSGPTLCFHFTFSILSTSKLKYYPLIPPFHYISLNTSSSVPWCPSGLPVIAVKFTDFFCHAERRWCSYYSAANYPFILVKPHKTKTPSRGASAAVNFFHNKTASFSLASTPYPCLLRPPFLAHRFRVGITIKIIVNNFVLREFSFLEERNMRIISFRTRLRTFCYACAKKMFVQSDIVILWVLYIHSIIASSGNYMG